jgi:hypothetical protein
LETHRRQMPGSSQATRKVDSLNMHTRGPASQRTLRKSWKRTEVLGGQGLILHQEMLERMDQVQE